MRIELEERCLLLHTEYTERRAAATLPGACWQPLRKCWSAPATPAVWRAVVNCWAPEAEEAINDDENIAILAIRELERIRIARQGPDDRMDYVWDTPPWKHQVGATNFVRAMDASLLHAWMGTGKSKIILDALRARVDTLVLILCPMGVLEVWPTEVEKHAPNYFRLLVLDGKMSVKARSDRLITHLAHALQLSKPLIVLVNYEAAWRTPLGNAILAVHWDTVVLDESHRIKAPGSKISRFCARLGTRVTHKIAMTGTPMPHSPLDLYGQYRFLDPGIFGTRFSAFRDHYAIMGGFEHRQVLGFRDQGEMRSRMDRLRYHITEDVLSLPALQTIDRGCQLEPQAARHYAELENDFLTELESGVVTASNALVKLLRLQQVAAGFLSPDGLLAPEQVSKAKETLLAELLEDLAGEPVVVFCRFRTDLEMVHRVGEQLGWHVGEISGRHRDYLDWRQAEYDLLAVQIQAGGLGIDLTRARVGIFYTLGFSLGDYQQAVARLHRPGQRRSTVIYRLLAKHTVDEKIVRALDKRKQVVDSILREGRS